MLLVINLMAGVFGFAAGWGFLTGNVLLMMVGLLGVLVAVYVWWPKGL